jgi:hypothetical protein
LTGKYWTATCNDTGGGSACGDEETPIDRPAQGIDVEIKRAGTGSTWRTLVEDVNANGQFRIRVELQIPELPPGYYKILVHDGGLEGDPVLDLRVARSSSLGRSDPSGQTAGSDRS